MYVDSELPIGRVATHYLDPIGHPGYARAVDHPNGLPRRSRPLRITCSHRLAKAEVRTQRDGRHEFGEANLGRRLGHVLSLGGLSVRDIHTSSVVRLGRSTAVRMYRVVAPSTLSPNRSQMRRADVAARGVDLVLACRGSPLARGTGRPARRHQPSPRVQPDAVVSAVVRHHRVQVGGGLLAGLVVEHPREQPCHLADNERGRLIGVGFQTTSVHEGVGRTLIRSVQRPAGSAPGQG